MRNVWATTTLEIADGVEMSAIHPSMRPYIYSQIGNVYELISCSFGQI